MALVARDGGLISRRPGGGELEQRQCGSELGERVSGGDVRRGASSEVTGGSMSPVGMTMAAGQRPRWPAAVVRAAFWMLAATQGVGTRVWMRVVCSGEASES